MSVDVTSWTADTSGVTADSGSYLADGSSVILFPDVPPLPGVPPLNRVATLVQQIVDATTGAAMPATSTLQPIPTGASTSSGPALKYAFLDSSNAAALTPDSVMELDFNADSDVMSHPIEEGGFAAYNRQQEAQTIRLMLACGGQGAMTRSNFLSTLGALREGTELVTIVLPDASVPNMTLKSFGYRKTAEHGAVTIWADTTWVEGRSTNVTVSAPPANQPQGNEVTPLGTLQELQPTSAQLAAMANPPVVPIALPAASQNEMPVSGYAF